MNFRQLIEKAMHEARDEFAAVVARKLEALMGTGDGAGPARRGPGRPPKALTAVATASRGRPRRSSGGKQGRAAPEHMAHIQEKVLHAMTPGQAMKKSAIMKAARLPDAEETRVRNVLAKLKSAGVLGMKGARGSAVYTLKS
jgi:hypothetical protein